MNKISHYRYFDDILIIYDKSETHIDTMAMEFNTIHSTINFTLENESDKELNFRDLTIHRNTVN
jgi:hypothetical protein